MDYSTTPAIAAPSTDIMEFEEDAIRVLWVLLGGRIFQGGALGFTVATQSADIMEFNEDPI